jgi:hypothetical protein
MGSLLKDTHFVGYSYEASTHKILPRFHSKKGVVIVPFHIGSFVTLVRHEDEWRDKFSVRFISENDIYARNLLLEAYYSNEYINKQGGKKKVVRHNINTLGFASIGDLDNEATSFENDVPKKSLKAVFMNIHNNTNVKFIELMVLRKFHEEASSSYLSKCHGVGVTVGGFDFYSSMNCQNYDTCGKMK